MTALEGAPREQGGAGGALREQRGSTKEQKGAAREHEGAEGSTMGQCRAQ